MNIINNQLPELILISIINHIKTFEKTLKYIKKISNSKGKYNYYINLLKNNENWKYKEFMYNTGVFTRIVYLNNDSHIIEITDKDIGKIQLRGYQFEFDISYTIFDELIDNCLHMDNNLEYEIPKTYINFENMSTLWYNISYNTENTTYIDDNDYGYFENLNRKFKHLYGIEEYRKNFNEGFFFNRNYKEPFSNGLIENYKLKIIN